MIAVTSVLFLVLFPGVGNRLLSDDVYYHLIVARGMLESGDLFPAYDEWFLAPTPRPHLYPPLFHWLLAGLSVIGSVELTKIALGLQVVVFPLALLAFFALARGVLSPRGAFLAVLLASTTFPFAARTHLAIPEAVELAMIPLALLAYVKRREWLCGAALLIMLLSHTGSPVLLAGAIAVHQWYVRFTGDHEARRHLLPILLLALPGLMLQMYWGVVNLTTPHVDADKLRPTLAWTLKNYFNPWLGLGPILMICLLSTLAFVRLRRHQLVRLCLPLVLAYSVILATFSARFSSYALIPLALVSALVLENWLVAGLPRRAIWMLIIMLVLNVPASFLTFRYRYDFTHGENEEKAFFATSQGFSSNPVCVTSLYEAYRVVWYTRGSTTLYELNCGDARLLYLRGSGEPSAEWRLKRQLGHHRLYARISETAEMEGSESS